MKVFYTKRGLDSYLFLMLLACVIAFTPLIIQDRSTVKLTLLIASVTMIQRLWELKTTYTILEEGLLQINYLFFKKKFEISNINQIEKGKRYRFHNRSFASTRDGLSLSLGDKLIFITPQNTEVFIEELLKINPSIQVSSK